MDVRRDVRIAELEPGLPPEPGECRLHDMRVVADAPALRLVDETGERVEDGVDVGRDVQAMEGRVVGHIHDRRDR